VSGQESKSFWGGNSLRPDVVLRKGSQTFIIDTKWKRPKNNTASVSDLRQMYAYCRFWDAEKALLFYPGDLRENSFKSYLTYDYVLDQKENHSQIEHQCKMGFVSALEDEGNLRNNIATDILNLLDF
jgi:5-methylcytosine-specific restriction enzyme subunit McrC